MNIVRRIRGSFLLPMRGASFAPFFALALAIPIATATSDGARETNEGDAGKEVISDPTRAEDEPELSVRVGPPTPSGALDPSAPSQGEPRLDALLRLPSGFMTTEPREVAGAGRSEWRRRFVTTDLALMEARSSLAKTRRELDGVAEMGGTSQWSIAAPGGDSSPSASPLSFKLRQQLRGDRERIVVTEKAKRELRIAADLAGVPRAWRVANSDSAEPGRPSEN